MRYMVTRYSSWDDLVKAKGEIIAESSNYRETEEVFASAALVVGVLVFASSAGGGFRTITTRSRTEGY